MMPNPVEYGNNIVGWSLDGFGPWEFYRADTGASKELTSVKFEYLGAICFLVWKRNVFSAFLTILDGSNENIFCPLVRDKSTI